MSITIEEFRKRRQRLAEELSLGSIAILPGETEKYRNNDTEYPFRQGSNFYYLTGFCEPNALLVILKEQDGRFKDILFCQPRIPEEEVWTGKRVGPEGALSVIGVKSAHAIQDLDRIMPELLANQKQIFYSLGQNAPWDERVLSWYQSVQAKRKAGVRAPEAWVDLRLLIHKARLIKSAAEIEVMRTAARISGEAHIRLMQTCQPNQMEYELEALFLYECVQRGCRAMAYPSIVGGGSNACVLHYIQNDKPLKSGELVLVDAGAEYQCYAADITRTFPVNGKFTEDQKAIYECVLKAQLAAIEQVRPGTRWDVLQKTIVRILVEGLVALDLLQGDIETLIQQEAYKKFYMHGSGHWLGLDVHDVGEYKLNGEYRPLEPGMVLTVEPGIYIASETPGVDKRWWGIGVRIEDDVLVTETGYEVLTEGVPKTVVDIEHYMSSKSG